MANVGSFMRRKPSKASEITWNFSLYMYLTISHNLRHPYREMNVIILNTFWGILLTDTHIYEHLHVWFNLWHIFQASHTTLPVYHQTVQLVQALAITSRLLWYSLPTLTRTPTQARVGGNGASTRITWVRVSRVTQKVLLSLLRKAMFSSLWVKSLWICLVTTQWHHTMTMEVTRQFYNSSLRVGIRE